MKLYTTGTSIGFFISLAILFLLSLIWIKPEVRPLPIGRFQPVTPNTAVDTTTGRLCWTYDPIGNGSEKVPVCKDLVDKR